MMTMDYVLKETILFLICILYIFVTKFGSVKSCTPILQRCQNCFMNPKDCWGQGIVTTEDSCINLLNNKTLSVAYNKGIKNGPYCWPSESCENTYRRSSMNSTTYRYGGCGKGCSNVTLMPYDDTMVESAHPFNSMLEDSTYEHCLSFAIEMTFTGIECTVMHVSSNNTCYVYAGCPNDRCSLTKESGYTVDVVTCDSNALTSSTTALPTSAICTPTSSATDPSTSSATDPSTSLATGPSTSSATGPSTSLATDPSTSLATGPSTSLATDPSTSSATDPSTSSATDPSTSSATGPSTSLATNLPTTTTTSRPKPPPIYILPCLCNVNSTFQGMTNEEIIQELQADTQIDEKATALAQQKLICQEDPRPSSKIIGTIGLTIILVIFGMIVFLDVISLFQNVIQRFRND